MGIIAIYTVMYSDSTDSLPDYGEVSCCFLKDDLSSFLRFAPLLILDKSLLKLSVGKCPLIIRDESLTSVLDTIDNNITMAILGKEGFSLYLPVKMHYVLDNTDNKVPVDTLFEIKCDNDTTLSILNKLCARVCISGYTTENAKIIVCIAKYTDNLSILSDYLENTVSNLHDTSVIADFNSLCKGIDGWKERFVAFVQRYISECSQSINVANIRHSHSELLPLKKAADISDAEYIRILTSGVNVDNNTEMLYQAFEQLGYKTELIMPVINIVRYYLTQILESKLEIHIRNRISDTFVSLYQSLEVLKTVSGVSSYLTYDVKDSFDKTDFIENYKTFVKKAEDIRKYRIFDEESFIALDGYIQIFDSIRDVIIMEKAVLEAPDSITRNYILEKIRSSDFKNAISDMYVRLQYELQNYYSMEDVGYEEGGQLTNAIRQKPFSIILFDEIEKAAKPNPRILDIFLQILEDGRLTDSKGETVSFSESIIIFTSNLGASEVTLSQDKDNREVADEFIKIVKKYFNEELKRPELLGRIGYSNIVPFNFIRDKGFAKRIAASKLSPVKVGIKEKYKLDLEFDNEEEFIDFVISQTDTSKGGRDILNQINDILLDKLAIFLFENKSDISVYRNERIVVTVVPGENGKDLSFEFDVKG